MNSDILNGDQWRQENARKKKEAKHLKEQEEKKEDKHCCEACGKVCSQKYCDDCAKEPRCEDCHTKLDKRTRYCPPCYKLRFSCIVCHTITALHPPRGNGVCYQCNHNATCIECKITPVKRHGRICGDCFRKKNPPKTYPCPNLNCLNETQHEGRVCAECWETNSEECIGCHTKRTNHTTKICGSCRNNPQCGVCGSCTVCFALGYDKLARCERCSAVVWFQDKRLCGECWTSIPWCTTCGVQKVWNEGETQCKKCLHFNQVAPCRECNRLTMNKSGKCDQCVRCVPCATWFKEKGVTTFCKNVVVEGNVYCKDCKQERTMRIITTK
jgi:hypothetical protein